MDCSENWAVSGSTGSGKSMLIDALLCRKGLEKGRIIFYFDGGAEGRSYLEKNDILLISPQAHGDILRKYGGFHQQRWQSFGSDGVPEVKEFLSAKNIEHTSPYEVTPLSVDEKIYNDRREKAVRLLKINHLMNRRLIQLSNGEMRKVLMARAIMQQPKLIVIDDPYYGLDRDSKEVFSAAINGMLLSGMPKLLIVINDQADIPENVTHVIDIEDRKIIRAGPKEMAGYGTLEKLDFNSGFKASGMFINKWGKGRAIIEMNNACVTYGGREVLKSVSWIMHEGENWLISGHNGAGKSTLLSLILADNPQAYSNDIKIFGIKRGSGESIWDIKKKIGWVAAELQYYYNSSHSNLDVVCSGFDDSIGIYRKFTEHEKRKAAGLMDSLGIRDRSGADFISASEGEKRLVLLARALVKRPELLVLDEPCQGLDNIHKGLFNRVLEQTVGSGKVSSIYVTHNLSEVPDFISHVLELREGLIIKCGPRYPGNRSLSAFEAV